MIPDPKWLDALKLPLKVTIGVALASIALLILDSNELIDFGEYDDIARLFVTILSVVFGILAVVGIGDVLLTPLREKRNQSTLSARRAVRRKEQEEQRAAAQAQALARLNHLSKEEIRVVAESLRKGSQSFFTYVHHPPVTMLIGKGLVWTPGGQHHQDHYPFSFHDWVWEKLLERKDEFLAKDDEHKREEEEAEKRTRRRRGY